MGEKSSKGPQRHSTWWKKTFSSQAAEQTEGRADWGQSSCLEEAETSWAAWGCAGAPGPQCCALSPMLEWNLIMHCNQVICALAQSAPPIFLYAGMQYNVRPVADIQMFKMKTITENHIWSKCREQETTCCPPPLIHLRLRHQGFLDHCKRRGRKIGESHRKGSLLWYCTPYTCQRSSAHEVSSHGYLTQTWTKTTVVDMLPWKGKTQEATTLDKELQATKWRNSLP